MGKKDAKASKPVATAADDAASNSQQPPAAPEPPAPAPARAGADAPSSLSPGIVNLAVHSVLMVAVPFGIFFSSFHGFFNREWPPVMGARRHTKPGAASLWQAWCDDPAGSAQQRPPPPPPRGATHHATWYTQ